MIPAQASLQDNCVRTFAEKTIPAQAAQERGQPAPLCHPVDAPVQGPAAGRGFDFGRIAILPPPPARGALPIQPKFTIGAVNDPLEHEADSTAEAILRMAEPVPATPLPRPGAAVSVQRKCACGGSCAKCQDEADRLRMKSLGPRTAVGAVPAPPIVHEALRSPGQSLDGGTRAFMQPRFGREFGDVRVHTDETAARSAAAIRAQAYTVGRDIVFAAGQFAPQTPAGRLLLAHELTHVVQQDGGRGAVVQRAYTCGDLLPRDPGEVAAGVLSGIAAHAIIQEDFARTVPTSRRVGIPGAYANPLRTAGLCGSDVTETIPQVVGAGPSQQSKAKGGRGFPDLASLEEKELLIAEIKPAVLPCLVDGEQQLARYVIHGNARDEEVRQWRGGTGFRVVLPMPSGHYHPPRFSLATPVGNIELVTGWCYPGLLGYTVRLPRGVPVRLPERVSVPQERPVRVRGRATEPDFNRFVGQMPEVYAPGGREYILALEAGLFGQIAAELGRQQLEQMTRVMRVDPRGAPFITVEAPLVGAAIMVAPFEIVAVVAMLAIALPLLIAAVASVVAELATAAAMAIEALFTAAAQSAVVATLTKAAATAVVLKLVKSGISEADASAAVKPMIGKRVTALVDVTDPWSDKPSEAADHQPVRVGGDTFQPIMRLTTSRPSR